MKEKSDRQVVIYHFLNDLGIKVELEQVTESVIYKLRFIPTSFLLGNKICVMIMDGYSYRKTAIKLKIGVRIIRTAISRYYKYHKDTIFNERKHNILN